MQNLSIDFSDKIARRGHFREVVDLKDTSHISREVIPITRDKFIDHVQYLMKRTKGRELQGTFNPVIVLDLFLE